MKTEYPIIQEEINNLEISESHNMLTEKGKELLKEYRTLMDYAHSSLPLKDKYAELSELAKAFIKEVDKQHPFVNLPEEEDFYMARHKLANSLKSNL